MNESVTHARCHGEARPAAWTYGFPSDPSTGTERPRKPGTMNQPERKGSPLDFRRSTPIYRGKEAKEASDMRNRKGNGTTLYEVSGGMIVFMLLLTGLAVWLGPVVAP